LLEEKRHHTGTSHSRICIDMISIARRKLLMLFGVPVLCRLQVERTNYNGLGLSTAIGAGIAASRRESQAGWNFRKGQAAPLELALPGWEGWTPGGAWTGTPLHSLINPCKKYSGAKNFEVVRPEHWSGRDANLSSAEARQPTVEQRKPRQGDPPDVCWQVQDLCSPSLTSGSSLIWCCSVLGRGTGTLPQLPGLLAK
jgi:hypothetical protein